MTSESDTEFYQEWKKSHKRRVRRWKEGNLERAKALDDGKWTKHTDYHWSRVVEGGQYGMRIDYWPSTDKMLVDDLSGERSVEGDAFNKLTEMGFNYKGD